jgi:hypothetical protein
MTMSDDDIKSTTLKLVSPELDEDEAEFRQLRRDLPGAKGASSTGIVSIGVGKAPGRNEFFRTHATFRPVVAIVSQEEGIEKQFYGVTPEMVEPLAAIGISVRDHTLYLTITSRGAMKIVPVPCSDVNGEQNDFVGTKEHGLLEGINKWVRLYTDMENRCYRVFPAPEGRFADPMWPDLKPAKIFRLGFRDRGRLIDSPQHPLFLRWAARDQDE